METFYLKVVSSYRKFYDGQCEMIIFPAIDGERGVLPNHESMVTALQAGELRLKFDGEWREAAVGNGFVEIINNNVTLITDFCEWAEEIDVKRAKEAKIRAEEKIRQKKSLLEYHHSKAALSRAMARLKVTSHIKKKI